MTDTMTASSHITAVVTSWPEVTAGFGSRGESAFKVNGHEIGHLHGDSVAHFFFPKPLWRELKAAGRIEHHPVFPDAKGPAARRIRSAANTNGTVRIDRLRRTDGSEIAMVYIPGVQTWVPGSGNPADVTSAFGAGTGANSAWRQTILTSLTDSGVSKDVPVVLAGHSLGGSAALDLAADPYVRASFAIHSVVTAGTGGGNFAVPEHITVISVRHVNDLAGYVGGTRAETSVDVRGGWARSHPHALKSYTAMAAATRDPRVLEWHAGLDLAPGISGTSSWYRGTVREPD
jgi:hypothetical protein